MEKTPEQRRKYNADFYRAHREEIRRKQHEYYEQHADELREKRRYRYEQERMETDPEFAARMHIR